jgi:hypothetical protein
VLRACHRVLKPGARLAFFVVAVADGLSVPDVARAIAAGPPHVDAGLGYGALMGEAGFLDSEIIDLTDEYAVTLSSSIQARDRERPRLERLLGPDRFAEGQSSRHQELDAVHAGLLRRHLITAIRP